MVSYALRVNGAEIRVTVAGDVPLLDVLHGLGLTGTRYGCGAEQCGACTVLVDGAPVYACTRDIQSLTGRDVLTVEGIGGADAPHLLQRAFLEEQAGQCGYCLSGILMSAVALLAGNQRPTRQEIVAALDRHLCRCGAHVRIIRAVARAAEAAE